MNATEIMALAMLLALVGRWANGQASVPSAKGLVEIIFALLVISLLDQGRTEPIAKGFAWIFLAAVVLSDNSPLTALSKIKDTTSTAAPASAPAAAAAGTPNRGGSTPSQILSRAN